MPEKAEMELLSLLQAFETKAMQLRRAVSLGDDPLVVLLDREIDPLLSAIVAYRAETPAGTRRQLHFIGSLIRDHAEDRASVLRHVGALSMLIDRYHGGNGEPAPAAACQPCAVASMG